MKPLLVILLVMVWFSATSQDSRPIKHPKTKEGYLKKSREQRTAGFILLGGGILGIAAVAPGNASFGTTGTVVVLSGAAILGSVPLFLAAGRNKRKSRRMSAAIELDRTLEALAFSKQNSLYHSPRVSIPPPQPAMESYHVTQ